MSDELREIKKLVVFSEKDVAGANIVKILIEKFNFIKTGSLFDDFPIYSKGDVSIVRCAGSSIHASHLDIFNPGICVFASRHKSESKKLALTCHSPGNYSTADAGGKVRELSYAPALYLQKAMNLLKIYGEKLPYDVSFEVTHHGPTNLSFPVLFVEVGSAEEQWNDPQACEAAANVIYEILTTEISESLAAIGFGGPHYAPNFTKISDKIALGHIAPKYAFDSLDREMIEEMVKKTVPAPKLAVFDWRGLKGKERRSIIVILDELKIEWKKTSDF